jgi:hypothetical protein
MLRRIWVLKSCGNGLSVSGQNKFEGENLHFLASNLPKSLNQKADLLNPCILSCDGALEKLTSDSGNTMDSLLDKAGLAVGRSPGTSGF